MKLLHSLAVCKSLSNHYYQHLFTLLFQTQQFSLELRKFRSRELVKRALKSFAFAVLTLTSLLFVSHLLQQIRGVVYPVELSQAFRQAPSMQMKGSLFIPWERMLYFPLVWCLYVGCIASTHFFFSFVFCKKNRSFGKSFVLMSYASLPLVLAGFVTNLLFDIWPAIPGRSLYFFLAQVTVAGIVLLIAWVWQIRIFISLRKQLFFGSNNTPTKKRRKLTWRNLLRVWRKYRAKFILRLQASIVLVSFLVLTLSPSLSLIAQVPVPDILLGEKYSPQQLQDTFVEASRLHSVDSWDSYTKGKLQRIQADWELAYDAEVEVHVKNVSDKDAYQDTEAYKDYLRKVLETHKEQQSDAWKAQATDAMLFAREAFLEELANKKRDTQEELSQTNTEQVTEDIQETERSQEEETFVNSLQ
ncbi:MAG: TIGR04388 family protein, partial [Spirochaetota bacterium]